MAGPLVGVAFGVAALLAGIAASTARAFPNEQLARGEEIWNSICSGCHGPDSTNPDAPLLLKQGSLKNYPTAAGLFEYVQGSMPQEDPSSLADQQYWDVLAFLLTKQGVTGGDAPLGPDNAKEMPTKPP